MDRRWGGLVLLILVALAAVAIPDIGGRRVPGSPRAASVPGPPAVGSCVISMMPEPAAAADPETQDTVPVIYPSAVYGPCAGQVVGEVMSLDTSVHPPVDATVGGYLRADAACGLDEVNYIGSIGPFDPATITTPGIAWQAAAFVDSVAVGPDPFQVAAGRTWTACIGATPDRTPYRGRIADALNSGVLPPDYAVCWRSLPISTDQQVEDQVMSCAAPHPIEILATTQIISAAITTSQVSQSCLRFASRAMRTTDPTRGGVVRISAYSMDGDSVLPLTAAALLSGYVGCVASVPAPARLVGTLIGLGDRPAPVIG